MKSHIKVEKSELPETIPDLRALDDNFWKNQILSYLLLSYEETDKNEIAQLIKHEKEESKADIENAIKKHVKKWFRLNEEFKRKGFFLNRESSSEGELEGFYDLKFQHSYWNYTKTYFAFECKNLGRTKSVSFSKSINEYVYVKEKNREDGGMYRYFIGKYASDINFGGMIGFVVGKTEKSVIEALIGKIYSVYENNSVGKLTKEKIIRSSIFENANTFDSIHIRKNSETKENEEFRLHHIIMNFIK